MKTPKRPALRYFGGKWKIAPWIIQHFPAHTTYVEPYGGAASVLLRKPPAPIEVYNDIYSEVVNFFTVLREHTEKLIHAITLTPYSRAEFVAAQQPATSPLERARRFYIWSWQGRGRPGITEPGGWRFMARLSRSQTPAHDWHNNGHLWTVAARLKQVHIEHDTAQNIITRYDSPETLFYIDPPYPLEVRSQRWTKAYTHEMTDNDHHELAQLLHTIQGAAIISSKPSSLYDNLYPNYQTATKTAIVTGANGGKPVTEKLWISPHARANTLPMFQTAQPQERQ